MKNINYRKKLARLKYKDLILELHKNGKSIRTTRVGFDGATAFVLVGRIDLIGMGFEWLNTSLKSPFKRPAIFCA